MMNGPIGFEAQRAFSFYCPHCGGLMCVAQEHVGVAVACPHCQRELEPWRLVGGPGAGRGGYRGAHPGLEAFSWRNRWVAGALGVLLGSFGVHRFYLGYTGIGALMAVLTVGSIFILSPIVAIWAFIEGILCFCGAMRDAKGLPLSG